MKKLRNRDLLDQFLGTKGNDGRAQSDPGTNTSTSNGLFYCAIRNIPSSMRSKDLRRYFSDFVENGKFHCFHFRHRPELQQESSAGTQKCTSGSQNPKTSTTCCVISFATQELRQVIMILRIILSEFIREYHGRHWMNNEGMEIPRRCFVNALKCTESSEGSSDSVTAADLREMIELKPPALMPHGNVGTPTEYFFEQNSMKFVRIQTGVSKLVLQRPKSDPTDQILQTQFGPDNDAGADDDDDQCEEWERHEALHDDVTEQDRIKPRKYEEEMEVVWEKGGPGLVWFTDKNYWDEREKGTDCDWAWADDWDVDYSVYYEGKSAGSKDARDAVEIREDDAKRTGKLEESVFTKKSASSHARRKRRNSDTEITNIEQYSKGIGSKLLGRMGWKPGSGLGRTQQGRVDPVAIHLEEDGQSGIEKKGFGYRGEKMMRTGFAKVQKVHAITSCFDEVTDKTVTPYKRVG
ncbi:unnamed protein product, partial [Nippostrongylus brasiliensis]|uniref:G-patch domain-containing protein n=1 Tax=Nippostrongylus brasiliensis TaxID=27835 RepID=A0A0N4XF72_NIPBR